MNSHEMQNRQTKASRLTAVLFEVHATAEDVLNATPEDWQLYAAAASEKFETHVNPPNSKATIDLILALLAREYAAEADEKAEAKWEESQEYGENRCPPRE